MKKDMIITICASLLILLFLYTAVYKLAGYKAFVESMSRQPLPNWSIQPLIKTIPSVEILASLLLFFSRGRFWGFLLSVILMTSFTGYVALVMAKAFGHIPCSCGGAIQSLNWPQHLVLNIIFLVIAVIGLVLSRHRSNASHAVA